MTMSFPPGTEPTSLARDGDELVVNARLPANVDALLRYARATRRSLQLTPAAGDQWIVRLYVGGDSPEELIKVVLALSRIVDPGGFTPLMERVRDHVDGVMERP